MEAWGQEGQARRVHCLLLARAMDSTLADCPPPSLVQARPAGTELFLKIVISDPASSSPPSLRLPHPPPSPNFSSPKTKSAWLKQMAKFDKEDAKKAKKDARRARHQHAEPEPVKTKAQKKKEKKAKEEEADDEE